LAAGSAGRVSTSTIHADLQELPAPAIGMGEWTVVGGESWQWYAGSGTIQQVRVRGRQGSSGIVTGAASGEPLQIVHWIPRRRNLLAALLFVHACTLVARRAAAPSAQLHASDEPAGATLVRACRLLGYVRVRESLTLYVRSPTPELRRPEAVRLTPYFSLSF